MELRFGELGDLRVCCFGDGGGGLEGGGEGGEVDRAKVAGVAVVVGGGGEGFVDCFSFALVIVFGGFSRVGFVASITVSDYSPVPVLQRDDVLRATVGAG